MKLTIAQTMLLLRLFGCRQGQLDRATNGYGPDDAEDYKALQSAGLLTEKGIFTAEGVAFAKAACEAPQPKQESVEEEKEVRTYVSERGHSLMFVGEPLEVPVITLENYEKWYEIHVVMPDGSVQGVNVKTLQEAENKDFKAMWIDHDFHPRLLYRVAELLDGCVHETAVEVAAGRWAINHWENAADFHEPEKWKPYHLHADKLGTNLSHAYGKFEILKDCKKEMERLIAADQWPGKEYSAVAVHDDGREWLLVKGEWSEM
jgi:hypothetical protein